MNTPRLRPAMREVIRDMFKEAATNEQSVDLEGYTSSVTGYISKCVEDVTVSKTVLLSPG